MPRRLRLAIAGTAAALALTACGGSPANDALEALDAAADLAQGDATFETRIDGADVAFGNGGGRPDWLEPEFVLPDGLDVQIAVNDPATGERAIIGTVDNGDAEAIRAQQHAALVAAGYEQLGDSDVFVIDGRRPLEIEIDQSGTTTRFRLEHRSESVQVLRDVHAPVEGIGSMAVTLGDERLFFEGPCSLRSSSGQFETADLSAGFGSITVEIRDGERNYVLANVATTDGTSWTIMQVDEAGNEPELTIDERGFTLTGTMRNQLDGSTAPVVIGVSCGA